MVYEKKTGYHGQRVKSQKLDAQIEQLEQKYMRHVTPEELAEHMEVSVEDVYQTVQEHFFKCSLY